MSENSAISWTHHTFNPWWGCAKVSPGCDNCYAERDSGRFKPGLKLWGTERDGAVRHTFGPKHWTEPYKWDKRAAALGERHRVFCASMADVFDNIGGGSMDEERSHLWSLINKTPNLDWLLLTKRVGNVAKMVPASWMAQGFPSNVWLGISVVNQDEADRDIPKLLALPARVRFLSCEPLLGPIDLNALPDPKGDPSWDASATHGVRECAFGAQVQREAIPKLGWVIAGGESGPKARPMHPAWARSLRDQCAEAGVPFHFKQWGEWSPGYAEHGNDLGYDRIVDAAQHEWPEGYASFLVGKKAAGRLLDGREHNGFPS